MTPGVDALASEVAWWLGHPWHMVGFYLGVTIAHALIMATFDQVWPRSKGHHD